MTTMIAEIYDALTAAGAPEEKAHKAAEAVAAFEARFIDLGARMERLDGRVSTLTWMSGFNIALKLLIFGRLFLAQGR
ncbi:MAG: integrase [Methylocella sp.]